MSNHPLPAIESHWRSSWRDFLEHLPALAYRYGIDYTLRNVCEDPMTEEIVYTILEAAKLLKVSDDTIRRLIKSGELDAVKVGNQWRIKKESVNTLLKKK